MANYINLPIFSDQSLTQKVLEDIASSTITYYGISDPGSSLADAVWKIIRVTVSGTLTTIEHADGNSNYDNVWNNRASLSYS